MEFYINRENRLAQTRAETVAQDPAEEKSTNPFAPDQMAGYTVTIIITAINLLVAYLILKRFVFKPMIALLEKRRESVETELQNALEKEAQAETRLTEAGKAVQNARAEAADILSEARTQAHKQSVMIVGAANETAEETRRKAENDAQRIHRASVELMRDEIADLAVSIAQKVIGNEICEANKKEVRKTILEESRKGEVRKD